MAVLRRVNWISQQRVDLPDLRSVESAVSNDFDDLVQAVITGTTQGYVVQGFELSMAGAIGGAASSLQMIVDPGALLHVTASQSGTVYLVPSGTPSQQLNAATNTLVQGSFAPNSINFVGLDYTRSVDDATNAQVYIWDPTTGQENTQVAPRALVLDFKIIISTTSFASNILPIAVVTTDASNNVTVITDARNLLWRLGTGGANPNPFYVYPWTAQSEGRTENPSTSSSNSINPFEGGDKMLFTMKDWMNAVMSSLLEIKGTTYWYSESSGGSIDVLREDLGNTVITGRGHISHSATTAGLINWDQDINIKVIGSELTYTLSANATSTDITLTEDQVAYITLIRGISIGPNLIWSNNTTVTSVGAVSWTTGLMAGDWIKQSADDDSGYYQIASLSLDGTTAYLTETFTGTVTGPGGAPSEYAYGVYNTSPTPSTSRNIYIANSRSEVPTGQNLFWLFLRTDDGGAIPKVYVRFLGAELDQGVTEEISDNKSQETLQYIGAPLESSYAPQYVSALDPNSVPQITQITLGAESGSIQNKYFLINSSGNARSYYVWFNDNGVGTDPMPAGVDFGIPVAISTGYTNIQVASAVNTALNSVSSISSYADFTSVIQTSPNNYILTVTNNSAGVTANATNFNVPSPFAIAITQSGTGTGNSFINDGDNLTLAIKKLDDAIEAINVSLQVAVYDETVSVVSSGATPPTSITGPISPGTLIMLPLNSRIVGNPQGKYVVGKGTLQLYLNGQYLVDGVDWLEYGSSGALSDQIEIEIELVVGDVLDFRISGGGGGGGGGEQGPEGPQGPQGPPGMDALNGPINISTKTNNYTVMLTDGFLLGDCTSNPITFTLPTAVSASGKVFYFKKIDSTGNAMVIAGNGTDTIDGVNTQTTTIQYTSFSMLSNGTSWYLF